MEAVRVRLRGLARRALDAPRRAAAARASAFGPHAPAGATLARYLEPLGDDDLATLAEWAPHVARLYRGHYFDVLGSGWVRVRHGMVCRGLEGIRYPSTAGVAADPDGAWLEGRLNGPNLADARKIWRLVDAGYVPIDWQLDVKSGFRWREATWWRDVTYGDTPGADVKVPWELARMHHLTHLAWAHALGAPPREGSPAGAAEGVWAREFRNEVLDFIATNPPGFGVNWRSPMDVAIRVANWLVAYDLFRAHGARFDAPFERELIRSAAAHARHVARHLEWHPRLRNNHYLANVAGLLVAAAYLPLTPETETWLALGAQELVGEVAGQFTPDGANFEASTSYHRLSAEMVGYATAYLLALPADKRAALERYDRRKYRGRAPLLAAPLRTYPADGGAPRAVFPAWYWERLRRMAAFTRAVTKPDGHVAQIGDNDSGRFLKLHPVFRRLTVRQARERYRNLDGYADLPDDADHWDEDHLDHRALPALLDALCDAAGPRRDGSPSVDAALVRGLLRRAAEGPPPDGERPAEGSDDPGPRLAAFPYFGLYVLRTERLFLAVRCGSVGQLGNGGHTHNDQLHVELAIAGRAIAADPGTYVYTPSPELRDRYRSVAAHFAPRSAAHPGAEPSDLATGLFRLPDRAHARCISFDERGFVGEHVGFGAVARRTVRVLEDAVEVTDSGAARGRWVFALDGAEPVNTDGPAFSPGYGKALR